VLFSVFAHGVSALPGMEIYAQRLKALPADAPELEDSEGEASPRIQ
jgi:hypothetical protein